MYHRETPVHSSPHSKSKTRLIILRLYRNSVHQNYPLKTVAYLWCELSCREYNEKDSDVVLYCSDLL